MHGDDVQDTASDAGTGAVTEKPASAGDTIPAAEKLALWVRSGGRCAMCNEYLLEHEWTTMPIPTGEMAHNVGRVQSEKSPRGMDDLPVEERNLAANLLLLCPGDHNLIDKALAAKEYTVEQLRALKTDHENRVRYVTGLRENDKTAVVRIIGQIRGGSPEASSETVRLAVRTAGKYPHYPLGVRTDSDMQVDLRQLPGEGEDAYWSMATRMLEDVLVTQMSRALAEGEVKHLSIFAFGRIPLLIHAGHLLDDKVPTDIYQYHRHEGTWVWPEDGDPVEFETAHVRGPLDGDHVALLCSLSGTVSLGDLPPDFADAAVYDLRPSNAAPSMTLLRSATSLRNFTLAYQAFLGRVEAAHPGATMVDVVPAVPLSVAVELGRGRSRDAHPALRVWDRAESSYEFALEVTP